MEPSFAVIKTSVAFGALWVLDSLHPTPEAAQERAESIRQSRPHPHQEGYLVHVTSDIEECPRHPHCFLVDASGAHAVDARPPTTDARAS